MFIFNDFHIKLAEPRSVTRGTTIIVVYAAAQIKSYVKNILCSSPGLKLPSHQFSAKSVHRFLNYSVINITFFYINIELCLIFQLGVFLRLGFNVIRFDIYVCLYCSGLWILNAPHSNSSEQCRGIVGNLLMKKGLYPAEERPIDEGWYCYV